MLKIFQSSIVNAQAFECNDWHAKKGRKVRRIRSLCRPELFKLALGVAQDVALFVPRNSDLAQLEELSWLASPILEHDVRTLTKRWLGDVNIRLAVENVLTSWWRRGEICFTKWYMSRCHIHITCIVAFFFPEIGFLYFPHIYLAQQLTTLNNNFVPKMSVYLCFVFHF